jgi:hypothetical protein
MGRKKKISFKLNPEWMLKEPLDFEYNKYTLLDYIQKCEKGFDKLEIYPDFVEISLHLANLQSLVKENTLLLTNKKFESCDDEILVKELTPKKPRELTEEEEEELTKTLKFSNSRLFDTFNIAKSIWNLAYDNIDLYIKKNRKSISTGIGYVFYYNKIEDNLFVWEYEIKKSKGDKHSHKTYMTPIYEGSAEDLTVPEIIETFSTKNQTDYFKDLPIFEIQSSQNFPMEQTLVPIMKRKIMAYIFQIVNSERINNFDFDS